MSFLDSIGMAIKGLQALPQILKEVQEVRTQFQSSLTAVQDMRGQLQNSLTALQGSLVTLDAAKSQLESILSRLPFR